MSSEMLSCQLFPGHVSLLSDESLRHGKLRWWRSPVIVLSDWSWQSKRHRKAESLILMTLWSCSPHVLSGTNQVFGHGSCSVSNLFLLSLDAAALLILHKCHFLNTHSRNSQCSLLNVLFLKEHHLGWSFARFVFNCTTLWENKSEQSTAENHDDVWHVWGAQKNKTNRAQLNVLRWWKSCCHLGVYWMLLKLSFNSDKLMLMVL